MMPINTSTRHVSFSRAMTTETIGYRQLADGLKRWPKTKALATATVMIMTGSPKPACGVELWCMEVLVEGLKTAGVPLTLAETVGPGGCNEYQLRVQRKRDGVIAKAIASSGRKINICHDDEETRALAKWLGDCWIALDDPPESKTELVCF